MKKKLTIALLIAVMALSAVSCTTADDGIDQNEGMITNVSWAEYYVDIGELCDAADLIAVGEISGVISESGEKVAEARWGGVLLYTTDFAFEIEQVLKGEGVEEILLHQTGAAGKQEISDDPLFEQGERCVLFLREYEAGKYCVLGGPQGRFMIIDDEVFSMNRILPDEAMISPDLDFDGVDLESFIGSVAANLEAGDV
ncbi:MAG: hypothetical protein E3J92_01340 [Dehalococcoidia bacterium]|nr:MAG: hypothetical protein E3J92_01340 [Dehalococcoidia bacterium]